MRRASHPCPEGETTAPSVLHLLLGTLDSELVKEMTRQEGGGGGGGWPLGLQTLNVRVGLVRNVDISESLSFSTAISAPSPSSSSATSSDLDTESTGSFFHDRSITLGSLLGITSILELSSRSLRRSRRRAEDTRTKKCRKTRRWCSLCMRLRAQLVDETAMGAPSLGYFLEAERRSSDAHPKCNVFKIHPLTTNRVDLREATVIL